MPTYVYEVVKKNGQGGELFEVVQPLSDAPLTAHPETGKPVRRVLQPPNIASKWTDSAMHRGAADDGKLERLGFTKYVKSGDGTYDKAFGKGPPIGKK
ncbi:MAG: FmdB family transcriptional regulator [bacterium]|nr:FmdB family transcriptional regulator [bacterium]